MLKFKTFIIISLLLACNQAMISEAAKKSVTPASTARIQTSLVVDGRTGKVLHAQNAHKKIYPASLAKGMTLYMLFEALASGKVSLNDYFFVSTAATKALPSKLHLKAGEKIKVKDAILALVVRSANDVAYVIAENVGGSEAQFIKLMTKRAKQLGMNNTNFTNASGWHDPRQVSTAADMAKLYMALKRDFPQYYHFCSKTSFVFKGKPIHGHNRVMANYPGVTGGKTGFTNPAGFNLVIDATRNGKSLVAVVTGSPSRISRDKKMTNLLDEHFGVRSSLSWIEKPVKIKKPRTKIKLASNKK